MEPSPKWPFSWPFWWIILSAIWSINCRFVDRINQELRLLIVAAVSQAPELGGLGLGLFIEAMGPYVWAIILIINILIINTAI